MLSQLSVFQGRATHLVWRQMLSQLSVFQGRETRLVWRQMLSQLPVFQVEGLAWSGGRC
jgi:hypothetical protein